MKLDALFRLVALGTACFLGTAASAQTVRIVDASGTTGDFLDIQSAIDLSTSGDVVLIRSGGYPGFSVHGKGLVIAADADATVTIQGEISIQNVSAGEELVLSGLRHRPAGAQLITAAISVLSCDGHVLLQDADVEFESPAVAFFGPLSVENCAAFTLTDSHIDATGATSVLFPGTFFVSNSNVYVHSSEIRGMSGGSGGLGIADGTDGGVGAHLLGDTTALFSGTTIVGGDGGNGGDFFGNPGDGGDGGPALRLSPGTTADPRVVLIETSLTGGAGGIGLPPDDDGAPGAPSEVVAGTLENATVFERRYFADAVVRDGEATTLSFFGQPFDLVWQILALDANPVATYLPEVFGAIHPGGSPFLFKFRGLLNGLGEKHLTPTLSPAGIDYLPFWEQALMYNASEEFVASNPRFVAFLSSTL